MDPLPLNKSNYQLVVEFLSVYGNGMTTWLHVSVQ